MTKFKAQVINHNTQITNHKQITIPNDQNSKPTSNFGIVILVFGIVCDLVLVIWNLKSL